MNNLREFFLDLDLEFLLEEKIIDDFCNIQMNLCTKRYLRWNDILYYLLDKNFIDSENKDRFLEKYIYLYPTHLDIEEEIYVAEASDLIYFFKIPS